MKRVVSAFLSALLLGGLLCGCGVPAAPEVPDSEISAPAFEPELSLSEPEIQQFSVSTVNELLAALGPNRVITLQPGSYDLTVAADYGSTPQNSYYIWEQVYDGYQLKLYGLNNLTIRGAGMGETVFETLPRYANVLALQNCSGVTLSGFTAGHTQEPGECMGGVLRVEGCWDVTLDELGLYGCGTLGVHGSLTTGLDITGCHIYQCSSSAVTLANCIDTRITDCHITEIGNGFYGGWAIFDMEDCSDVFVSDTLVGSSTVNHILSGSRCRNVSLANITFGKNRVQQEAFRVTDFPVTMDNCQWADNVIRMWFPGYSTVTDSQGNPYTEEDMLSRYPSAIPESASGRNVVEVATVDEFLAAIAPDTEIVLTAAMYDFSTATGYGETGGTYYTWVDIYDGPGLVIMGVNNLVIRSNDGDITGHTLCAVPRYADVLTFAMCSNVTLSGFTAGHTQEPGLCTGGVIYVRDCDSIRIENCGLYGCGILGVQAECVSDLTVSGCDIYECSQGGIRLYNVVGAVIEECTFRDLGGETVGVYDGSSGVIIDGAPLPDEGQ